MKEWLECSAGQFNQIDPKSSKPQPLINWDGFRTYNFDVIDGVNYQIDVTQPAKYDGECRRLTRRPNASKPDVQRQGDRPECHLHGGNQ